MSEKEISILNELIQINQDSEEGFLNAANNITDHSLKQIFIDKAANCKNAVSNLQHEIVHLGGKFEHSGSLLGALHRGWVNIKGNLSGKKDHNILIECVQGEGIIKEAYAKALENDLSGNVRTLIQNQYETVANDYEIICSLQEKFKNNMI